ncbi:MAG: autotransporter-associated beta strand repeat-containing protein [Opitutaceae bacterium]
MKNAPSFSAALLGVVVGLMAVPSAHATQRTWTGTTDTAWATGANWGGTAPSNSLTTDTVLFNSSTYANLSNAGTTSIAGISVGGGNTGDLLTISGTALSMGSSGFSIDSGSGAVGLSATTVKIGANQSWANNSTGLFTVSSAITNVGNSSPFTLTLSGSGSGLLGGIISNGGATGTTAITKTGTGSWTMSNTNTYSGATTVSQGTLNLTSSGTVGTGALTVNVAGTLTLDNTSANADRIGNSVATTVSGKLNLMGNGSAGTSETAGVLTQGAAGTITLTPGPGQSALLTFSSLAARTVGGGATGLYRGTGLGSALGADTSNIIFTTTPTVSALGNFAATDGVGTLGTENAAVLRGIVFDNIDTGTGLGFATYDSTNGVRSLNASTEQTTTYAAGNANVRLDLTGAVGITGAATNTLQLDNVSGGAQTVTNTGTAFAPQNGLLFTGGSAITLTGGTLDSTLNASNKEVILLSANTAGVTIGTALKGTNVTIGGTGNITLSGAVTAGTLGSGFVRINSSGITTLAAAETGALVINNGTLKLAAGGSVYATTDAANANTTVNLQVNGLGATFDLNGINAATNAIQGSGTITNGSGAPATLTLAYRPSGGNFQQWTASFGGSITGNVALSFTNSASDYYQDRFTQVLSGNNTFTGGVTVNGAGGNGPATLRLQSATALGTGRLTITAGAKIDTNGQTLTTNNLQTWSGAWIFGGSSGTIGAINPAGGSLNMGTGAVTLTGNSGVNVSANTLTVGGAIGESGGARNFTKTGAGTLVFGGINTYTGTTTVSSGALTVNSGATLSGATAPLVVSNPTTGAGTTVSLNLNSAQMVGSLSGTKGTPSSGSNVAQINLIGGSTVLTVNQTAANSFAGIMTGAGGFTLGSGSNQALTLTGTNTYTGATTVTGGKLVVNGSLAAGSAVSIGALGTLGGSGTVGGTVAVSGTISPGNSPGTLTTGAETWITGGAYVWEINNATGVQGTNWDFISSTGTLDITGLSSSGKFNVNVIGLTAGDVSGSVLNWTDADASWKIASFTSVVGTFASNLFNVDASGFTNNNTAGGVFTITNTGGDIFLNYTAVPEPATYAAIFGALALAGAIWRSRKRRA